MRMWLGLHRQAKIPRDTTTSYHPEITLGRGTIMREMNGKEMSLTDEEMRKEK